MYSGRIVAGFGVGGISAVAPTFVSECAPKEVRGRITGLFQIMISFGVMLSYWINCESLYSLHVLWMLSDRAVVQWERLSISVAPRMCGGFRWAFSSFQRDSCSSGCSL